VPERNQEIQWTTLKSDNFESPEKSDKPEYFTDSLKYSGNYSFRLDLSHIYSPFISVDLASLDRRSKAVIRCRVRVLHDKEQHPEKIILVMSVYNEKNETIRYLTMSGSYFQSTPPGQWLEMYIVTQVSTLVPKNGCIKLYVWYQGDQQILVDDLCLDVLSVTPLLPAGS
jgi:hypothetical protein